MNYCLIGVHLHDRTIRREVVFFKRYRISLNEPFLIIVCRITSLFISDILGIIATKSKQMYLLDQIKLTLQNINVSPVEEKHTLAAT